jgi:hypothetical protein
MMINFFFLHSWDLPLKYVECVFLPNVWPDSSSEGFFYQLPEYIGCNIFQYVQLARKRHTIYVYKNRNVQYNTEKTSKLFAQVHAVTIIRQSLY